VKIELAGVLVAAEVALAHERWTISYGAQNGRRASRSPEGSQPTLVMRLLAG